MYTFNFELFYSLPRRLGIQIDKFAKVVDINENTLYRYRRVRKDIPLLSLIKLCNHLHISISYFITLEGCEEPIDSKFDADTAWRLSVSESDFQPITFKHQQFGDDVTTNALQTVNEACDMLNISQGKFYNCYREPEPPMSLFTRDFLAHCDRAKLYPGNYIIDFNRKIETCDSVRPMETNLSQQLTARTKQLASVLQKNKELVTKVRNLEEELRRLRQELCTYKAYNSHDYGLVAAEKNITTEEEKILKAYINNA